MPCCSGLVPLTLTLSYVMSFPYMYDSDDCDRFDYNTPPRTCVHGGGTDMHMRMTST